LETSWIKLSRWLVSGSPVNPPRMGAPTGPPLPRRSRNHNATGGRIFRSNEIDDCGDITHLSLSQDNNRDEPEAEHATENWSMMLGGLKKTVEERRST
jgi:hypothetical protein